MIDLLSWIMTALLVLGFAAFWAFEFIQLMLLSDADFPGRFDKVLWFVAFLLVFALTPFIFLYWKHAYLALRRKETANSETRGG